VKDFTRDGLPILSGLGGCDVGCVWCDVKDSWDVKRPPQNEVEDIVSFVTANTPASQQGKKAGLVVITGGEPLMHDLTGLTAALKEKGFETNIETSGAYPVKWRLGLDLFIAQKVQSSPA
jgi:organic radical activating enzyme